MSRVLECQSINTPIDRGGLTVKRLVLVVALVVAASTARIAPPAHAASAIDGLWDAVVVVNDADIPFRFEITTSGAEAQGFFFEGDRKVGSTKGSFVDGVLKLEYDFLNTTLEATLTGGALTGTYRNNRPNARPQDVRMRRFTPVAAGSDDPPPLAGTWEMRRVAEEVSAPRDTRTWHVFLR